MNSKEQGAAKKVFDYQELLEKFKIIDSEPVTQINQGFGIKVSDPMHLSKQADKKAQLISLLQIPTDKNELLEFARICVNNAVMNIPKQISPYLNIGPRNLKEAWKQKASIALSSLHAISSTDPENMKQIELLEAQINTIKKSFQPIAIILFIKNFVLYGKIKIDPAALPKKKGIFIFLRVYLALALVSLLLLFLGYLGANKITTQSTGTVGTVSESVSTSPVKDSVKGTESTQQAPSETPAVASSSESNVGRYKQVAFMFTSNESIQYVLTYDSAQRRIVRYQSTQGTDIKGPDISQFQILSGNFTSLTVCKWQTSTGINIFTFNSNGSGDVDMQMFDGRVGKGNLVWSIPATSATY